MFLNIAAQSHDEIERAIQKVSENFFGVGLAYSLNFKTKWKNCPPNSIDCENIHSHFINKVQKNLGKQKLFNIAGLQKTERFHVHGFIEKPKGFGYNLVAKFMVATWAADFEETTIGREYKDYSIEKIYDKTGWILYSTRLRTSIERLIPTNSLSWSSTV